MLWRPGSAILSDALAAFIHVGESVCTSGVNDGPALDGTLSLRIQERTDAGQRTAVSARSVLNRNPVPASNCSRSPAERMPTPAWSRQGREAVASRERQNCPCPRMVV